MHCLWHKILLWIFQLFYFYDNKLNLYVISNNNRTDIILIMTFLPSLLRRRRRNRIHFMLFAIYLCDLSFVIFLVASVISAVPRLVEIISCIMQHSLCCHNVWRGLLSLSLPCVLPSLLCLPIFLPVQQLKLFLFLLIIGW